LVFLRGGGDGGLRRWSLLTPLVEAPTGNIISSSLNGFSLSIFSGSGRLELDIFAVREVSFRRFSYEQVAQKDLRGEAREKSMSKGVHCRYAIAKRLSATTKPMGRFQQSALGVLHDLGKQDLFLVVIVKEIFDRFQFVARNDTWVRKQLVYHELFKPFLAFNQPFLFVSLELGLLLKRPSWQVKCLSGFIDEPTRVQGIGNLSPEPGNLIGQKLGALRFFSPGDDFYGCFLKRFRFLDQCFELGNPSFPDNLIRIAFGKNHRLYGEALRRRNR